VAVDIETYINGSNKGTSNVKHAKFLAGMIFSISSKFVNLNQYFICQENQHQYPILFHLAMDILPIQGSSVPCEHVFSSGKETTTDRRSCISPELMEALQLLKFSLRQGHPLDFTTGTSWDDELAEVETAHNAHEPEDLDSFVTALNTQI